MDAAPAPETMLVGKHVPAEVGLKVLVTETGRKMDVEKLKRGDCSQGGQGTIVEVPAEGICTVKWDLTGEVFRYATGAMDRFQLTVAAADNGVEASHSAPAKRQGKKRKSGGGKSAEPPAPAATSDSPHTGILKKLLEPSPAKAGCSADERAGQSGKKGARAARRLDTGDSARAEEEGVGDACSFFVDGAWRAIPMVRLPKQPVAAEAVAEAEAGAEAGAEAAERASASPERG